LHQIYKNQFETNKKMNQIDIFQKKNNLTLFTITYTDKF